MASSNIDAMTPRSEAVFGVTVAFFTCATLFVSLRIVSRACIVRKVTLDDYFMLFAWVRVVHQHKTTSCLTTWI